MTLVWGIGLAAENIVRYWIVSSWTDFQHAATVSHLLKYGVYGGLTLWTISGTGAPSADAPATTRGLTTSQLLKIKNAFLNHFCHITRLLSKIGYSTFD